MNDRKLYCVVETVENEVFVLAESSEEAQAHARRHDLFADVQGSALGTLYAFVDDIDELGDDQVWDDEAHQYLDREEARDVLDGVLE